MPAAAWRTRLAGAFQDFFKFELAARHAVGLGELARLDDDRAILTAIDRAGAGDVIARLPSGLATRLGPSWPGGVDLSFGQWQKLALARGFMRASLASTMAALVARSPWEGSRGGSTTTRLTSSPDGILAASANRPSASATRFSNSPKMFMVLRL